MQPNLPAANWSAAPLRDLIRHIVLEYHDCFRLELPQLERCMAAREALRALRQTLDATLAQEEEELFPAIRKCEEAAAAGVEPPRGYASTVRALIPMVTRNNDRLAELSHEILQPQAGAPKPLANLAIDISGHVYLENEILFPRALKLLE
jgi:iron-sulfur cluster repair protein YtfE (RIC family)